MAGEFKPPFDKEAALAFDSEHLLRTENIPFDIDNWYPKLRKWTFETRFLPLRRSEASAIIRAYRLRFLGRSGELEAAEVKALQSLEDRLQDEVETHFSDGGCFMRLCGRSAKDAEPLDRGRVRSAYEAELREAARRRGGAAAAPLSPEERMAAAARVDVLRARTAEEVMHMLLTSERVYSDLLDWLWFGEPEQVVLRRWNEEVSVDYEFRLYVHKNRLTAISQYDHHCYYRHLAALKQELERRLVELWTEIHPHVGTASYAMDFVYLPKSDQILLVELSPFLRCTGAHCFRWDCRADLDVLEGRRPFEFRLVEKQPPYFVDKFCSGWEERWYPERRPDGDCTLYVAAGSRLALEAPYWELYQTPRQRRAAARRRRFAREVAAIWRSWRCCGPAREVPAWTALGGGGTSSRRFARSGWTLLFCYGTLKRGMHWNRKFLAYEAVFLATATTAEPVPLVVGRCGVPYLLLDCVGEGEHVRGELWAVGPETLEGLDQYEGVGKAYYKRPELLVVPDERPRRGERSAAAVTASVYGVARSPAALRALRPLPEYTLAMHQETYNPIEHILLKQQLYLQGRRQYSSCDLRHPSRSLEDDARVTS